MILREDDSAGGFGSTVRSGVDSSTATPVYDVFLRCFLTVILMTVAVHLTVNTHLVITSTTVSFFVIDLSNGEFH